MEWVKCAMSMPACRMPIIHILIMIAQSLIFPIIQILTDSNYYSKISKNGQIAGNDFPVAALRSPKEFSGKCLRAIVVEKQMAAIETGSEEFDSSLFSHDIEPAGAGKMIESLYVFWKKQSSCYHGAQTAM